MNRTGSLRLVATVAVGGLLVILLGYGVSLAMQPRQDLRIAGQAAQPGAPTLSAAPAAPAGTAAGSGGAVVRTLDETWVASIAAKTGIPAVALRAYANAQLKSPADCHLGWTTLAGIGWVESQHGTLGGRALAADGLPSSAITGIPLGNLDRAYGPMQFIPSTWKTWGADATGDGVADPQNINDAALAAARYLCASGSLATGAGWSAAVFSYNHSQAYVEQVYAAAQAYATRVGG